MAHENDRIGNNFGTTGIAVFFSKLDNCIVKYLYFVTISTKLIANVIECELPHNTNIVIVLAYD